MGNRAIVLLQAGRDISPAIYLHWNGGPESIYAFIAEFELRKYRTHDVIYGAARFVQIVADFFGINEDSLGIANGPRATSPSAIAKLIQSLDSDNGVYIVSWPKGVRRVRRFTNAGVERSPELVAFEAKKALADPVAKGIAEFFEKFRAARNALGDA